MLTFLSQSELTAIKEELEKTPDSTSVFTLGLDQAKSLVNEVLLSRGEPLKGIRANEAQQIDLFDTSYLKN